jgi:hypothetical protein
MGIHDTGREDTGEAKLTRMTLTMFSQHHKLRTVLEKYRDLRG